MARYVATMTFEVFAATDKDALSIAEHRAKLQDNDRDDRAAIRELHCCPFASLDERKVDIEQIRMGPMTLSDLSTNMLIWAREGHVIAAKRHPRSNKIIPEPCIHHTYISDINKVLVARHGDSIHIHKNPLK